MLHFDYLARASAPFFDAGQTGTNFFLIDPSFVAATTVRAWRKAKAPLLLASIPLFHQPTLFPIEYCGKTPP